MDGEKIFGYRLNSYLFAQTRYVNSYTHYGMQKGSRNELLSLAVQDGTNSPFITACATGAQLLGDDAARSMRITAWDDSGNSLVLTLRVRRDRDDTVPRRPGRNTGRL